MIFVWVRKIKNICHGDDFWDIICACTDSDRALSRDVGYIPCIYTHIFPSTLSRLIYIPLQHRNNTLQLTPRFIMTSLYMASGIHVPSIYARCTSRSIPTSLHGSDEWLDAREFCHAQSLDPAAYSRNQIARDHSHDHFYLNFFHTRKRASLSITCFIPTPNHLPRMLSKLHVHLLSLGV
jgi:hypothetical protein